MEKDLTIEKISDRLAEIFWGGAVYRTKVLKDVIDPETKKQKSETRKYEGENSKHLYYDHLTTEYGLTVAPIVENEFCFFGALDIDKYQLSEEELKRFIIGAKQRSLVVARTKSGGLHLYCFASEQIPARLMRNRLACARDELALSPKTEIFPKQSKLDDKTKYGNAITIAYRGAFTKDHNYKCVALDVKEDLIIELRIGEFLDRAEYFSLSQHNFGFKYFKNWEDYKDPVDHTINNSSKEKNMSMKNIIQAIKDKTAHSQGGTYDNWITLYIAKAVKGFKTDDEINQELEVVEDHKNTPYTEGFHVAIAKKINACRKKFDIPCPSILQDKVKKNIIYILDEDRYFNIEKGKTYKEDVLNKSYRRLFQRPLLSTWLQTQPDRLEVESRIWAPKYYSKESPVFDADGFKYLNTYIPNDLEAVPGDTRLFHKILDSVFTHKKTKEHFLDWLSYPLQHPGTKIRYAFIIISKEEQIGKGSIFRVIQQIYGEHNTKVIDVDEALDHAKNYLKTSAIVLIDEMESKGDYSEKRSLLNKMKRIITESIFSHRNRYSDYDEKGIQSCTNIMFFSNNLDAMSLPKKSKRYVVVYNDKDRLPQTVYDEYHKWVDDGGAKHVLHELMNRDVEHFNSNGVAPDSIHTAKMIEAGAHPLAQLLKARLETHRAPLDHDIVSTMEVYDCLKESHDLNRANLNKVSECLEFIGGIKRDQVPITNTVNGENRKARANLFIVRDHDKYKNLQNRELAEKYRPSPSQTVDEDEVFRFEQIQNKYNY
jgi:hypothetical protein